MATFRPWKLDQQWLLPPSVHDFVPPDHVAHFVRETVRTELDLSSILAPYQVEQRGYPAYHPVMMTALLLYGYSRGVYSSRKLATACVERLDFMAVTGMQRPDFRTISDFRKRHLTALSDVFVQVLQLCKAAGLTRLGHVALDGTKVKASASKRRAMSYERMVEAEPRLAAEVEAWLDQANEADSADDKEHGENRGDEMPAWVANKQKRLAKIREAKAALEAEAAAKEAERQARAAQRLKKDGTPYKARKTKLAGKPDPKAQRNFTDPESRIMKTGDGYGQCYNAQAAVDAESYVIVSYGLTNNGADTHQLVPLLDRIKRDLNRKPREVSADAGYLSEPNLEELERRKIRGYVALGRRRHTDAAATGARRILPGTYKEKMADRLRRGGWRSRYRLRKQTVETVFGNIKSARGFDRFSLRGEANASAEWSMVCSAHNLLKLWVAQ